MVVKLLSHLHPQHRPNLHRLRNLIFDFGMAWWTRRRVPDLLVTMDWASKHASQFYANPKFQEALDDRVRKWNPGARDRTGTVDKCGWPDMPNGMPQYFRRNTCLHDDFRKGLNSSILVPSLTKGCCIASKTIGSSGKFYFNNDSTWPRQGSHDSEYEYAPNIGVEEQEVEFPAGTVRKKNVVRLTAINGDNGMCSGRGSKNDPLCHKTVFANGALQTMDLFASARFDVVAKVPADQGLVWAIWTFHYEEHIPHDGCEGYSCFRDGFSG
eukprot:g123.t1